MNPSIVHVIQTLIPWNVGIFQNRGWQRARSFSHRFCGSVAPPEYICFSPDRRWRASPLIWRLTDPLQSFARTASIDRPSLLVVPNTDRPSQLGLGDCRYRWNQNSSLRNVIPLRPFCMNPSWAFLYLEGIHLFLNGFNIDWLYGMHLAGFFLSDRNGRILLSDRRFDTLPIGTTTSRLSVLSV